MRTMNSPVSSSDDASSGFSRLDPRIQRWIWTAGWTSLRDAQEQAIPALIEADRDVIIAAATAAGKTEAAFLPILTHLLRDEPDFGCVLYVSPLKALINDQWDRLSSLCESLELPVVPWHGDVAASRKQRFLKHPQGILLITPESLEALFVNRGSAVASLFVGLQYLVVDELHAFIGLERGKQLQSLMHRVERVVGRRVPRIGLSATLGDMGLASAFLRPSAPSSVELIVSESVGQELKVLVKAYEESVPIVEHQASHDVAQTVEPESAAELSIGDHLYEKIRGSNNLVFPNSRGRVERYADLLRRRCEREGVPNEFWPHHGSLSREIREETESALKRGDRPATAICTTTLELGIDIGSVKSIVQIGAPPSVASLRQRLGRSGRRAGEAAILRAYCVLPPLNSKSALSDRLREELVQIVAMIELLLANWFEPPRVRGIHASTLVQQLLSMIAECGGITAADAWKSLVRDGVFSNVEQDDFVALLRSLGDHDLITQDSTGLLLHGEKGERLVNHYDFYAAFVSDDEFVIVSDGKPLGSLPISHPIAIGQRIIFAGRRWQAVDIDTAGKTIFVKPDPGGVAPAFGGGAGRVHDDVRRRMREVLASDRQIAYLDKTAQALLDDARRVYREARLGERSVVQNGADTLLMTWRGDWVNDALTMLLADRGLAATNEGIAVNVARTDADRVMDALDEIVECGVQDVTQLLSGVRNLENEKWDWALPRGLLCRSFAASSLDVAGAMDIAAELVKQKPKQS